MKGILSLGVTEVPKRKNVEKDGIILIQVVICKV